MFYKISPKTRYVFEIRALAIAFATAFINALIFPRNSSAFIFITICWIAAFIFYCSVCLPMYMSNVFISISQNNLVLNSGIFNKSVRIISLRNIQYVECRSTPVQKLFSLSSIIIYAAGGKFSTSCFDINDAEQLCIALSKSNGGEEFE